MLKLSMDTDLLTTTMLSKGILHPTDISVS